MIKHCGKFVSYLRVSTKRQGESGLGLEAQRAAVATWLNGGSWQLVEEHVEVESGKRDDNRPALAKAFEACNAKLVIAKLDRLSRDAHFLLGFRKPVSSSLRSTCPRPTGSPSASWRWLPNRSARRSASAPGRPWLPQRPAA
jgi:hypothetical protein